ncbi:MAG: hypothetical protein ACREOU_02190 [Candidatus Eiseniibacteriota bacterium]
MEPNAQNQKLLAAAAVAAFMLIAGITGPDPASGSTWDKFRKKVGEAKRTVDQAKNTVDKTTETVAKTVETANSTVEDAEQMVGAAKDAADALQSPLDFLKAQGESAPEAASNDTGTPKPRSGIEYHDGLMAEIGSAWDEAAHQALGEDFFTSLRKTSYESKAAYTKRCSDQIARANEALEGLFPWEQKYAVTGVPATIQAFDPERQTLQVRIPWSNRPVNGVRFFAPGQAVSHAQWKKRYGDPSGMILSVRFQSTPAEAKSYRESAEPTTAEIMYQLERFEVAINPLPSYALLCRALRTVGVVPTGVRIRQGETVLYEESFGSEVASGD